MATAEELVDLVKGKILDNGYDDAAILGFLNRGSLEIAAWENREPALGFIGNILLDPLQKEWSVTTATDAPYVSLPPDYLKHLFRVTFEGLTLPVEIVSNLREFLGLHGDVLTRPGPVERVTIGGGRLYYNPVPAEANELRLFGYRKPDVLVTRDPGEGQSATPYWLPEHLHYGLLVGYACKEIFNETEDGVEAGKVNTLRYEAMFHAALARLDAGSMHKAKQIQRVPRRARFF